MKLDVQSEEGNVTLVAVQGEVKQKDLAEHEDPLADLLGEDCYRRKVLLNLRGVESLDSSGVGWLLSCHKAFRTQGGMLVLHSVSPFARDVLKMLKMHLVLHIADDEAEARKLAQGEMP